MSRRVLATILKRIQKSKLNRDKGLNLFYLGQHFPPGAGAEPHHIILMTSSIHMLTSFWKIPFADRNYSEHPSSAEDAGRTSENFVSMVSERIICVVFQVNSLV